MKENIMSFSKKSAIKIQQSDLIMWKGVLSKSAYDQIEAKCIASNSKVKPGPDSGHQILRGLKILNLVNGLAEGVDINQTLTTSEAFRHLSEQRGWYKKAGLHKDTARSFKRHFKEGNLGEWRMSEILKAAGYIVQPAVWSKPSGEPSENSG